MLFWANMKTTTLLFILTLIFLFTNGQKQISTKGIEDIADNYSIDSALKTVRPFTDIFQIDTSVALCLAIKCNDLKNYSRQFAYFTTVGQVIKNQAINSKAVNNLKAYKHLFSDTIIQQYKAFVIPDQIFHVLVFQNDHSVIPILKSEFNFWNHKADSIKTTYPSGIKRFFQRFKGTPPSEQLFSDCKENCYKLAWTLHKFGENDFSLERANAIRQQLVPYLRNYDMERFKFESYQFASDTIKLTQSYKSIAEIDFEREHEFTRFQENLRGDKCWKQIITNHKRALYEVGCQWAPLTGQGKTIRLKLLGDNKLQVTIINSWKS